LDSQKTDTERESGYWAEFLQENYDSAKGILILPKYAFLAGRDYNITVGATSDGTNYGEGQLYINVIQSPLEVVVDGGNRAVSVNKEIVLDNLKSTDPDDPEATDFECTWTCEDWTEIGTNNPFYSGSIDAAEWNELEDEAAATYLGYKPEACTTATGGALPLDSEDGRTLTIAKDTMAPNSFYYFKSSCTKGDITYDGYNYIKGIQAAGDVFIVPKQLKPNWKNRLNAEITSNDENAYVQWSLENDVDGFHFNGATNRLEVVFDSSLLQSGTVYTFRADLYENGEQTAVYATLDTMLLSPPYGGSFTVSPTRGTIETIFTATFANWETTDDSEITYKVNIADSSNKIIAGQYSMLTEMTSKLPGSSTGNGDAIYTVSAQVYNGNGYATTTPMTVTITQPSTE